MDATFTGLPSPYDQRCRMVKAVSPGQTGSAGRNGWEISQIFLETLIFHSHELKPPP